jgi:hypothetical protein
MPFCQARTRARTQAWHDRPTRSPVRGLELGLAALLALPMATLPPWTERWTRPLAARAAEASPHAPLSASRSGTGKGKATLPKPSAAGTAAKATTKAATTEAAGGCRLSFGQMQGVARGNVLRLRQGDCVMQFNTLR